MQPNKPALASVPAVSLVEALVASPVQRPLTIGERLRVATEIALRNMAAAAKAVRA